VLQKRSSRGRIIQKLVSHATAGILFNIRSIPSMVHLPYNLAYEYNANICFYYITFSYIIIINSSLCLETKSFLIDTPTFWCATGGGLDEPPGGRARSTSTCSSILILPLSWVCVGAAVGGQSPLLCPFCFCVHVSLCTCAGYVWWCNLHRATALPTSDK
jgi:hypothetical protein